MPFKTITPKFPLILASASPRRKSLLEQIRIPFQVIVSEMKENHSAGGPAENARALALQKAQKVAALSPGYWTLGADTIVVLGENILGKPQDPEAVRSMLRRLSGREHEVITGFALLSPDGRPVHQEAVVTQVRFKNLSQAEIETYLATNEPFGKAGSYAIQGIGVFLVESITGSYTNVVGLPLCALTRALVTCGALSIFPLR
ncbi:MAG: septum formation protein Maf [Desulfobacteraceae bacterium]|nr:MAG: septum formation protein Maf [Desulfobacteraceae bacterium]